MLKDERFEVIGIKISRLNLQSCCERIFFDLKNEDKLGYLCATDSHVLYQAGQDAQFKKIVENSYMSTPDGMPLVWSAWLQGKSDVGRVYGPDLMLKLCDEGQQHKVKHFFYGGRAEVLDNLVINLKGFYPNIKIVGYHSPPFRNLRVDELDKLKVQIEKTKPDIMWVGLGAPKQERFAARFVNELDAKLFCCVGAAFDFCAGNVSQAPEWMQANGMEWLFRLKEEPERLWKRYFKGNFNFLWSSLLQFTGFRRTSLY